MLVPLLVYALGTWLDRLRRVDPIRPSPALLVSSERPSGGAGLAPRSGPK
ncbi:MAG: hypothetical protein OEY14_12725 [Myxococcales bacterium]|nr:hypothetical protein [Myxococcales bacterium]